MINNRQNGRRRGRNGQRPGGGGNPGRPESGNRIDNRARGNASQLYEKYKTLAADAQRQGDRVNTEYYLQFADHYFRVLAESRPRFEEQQQARARGRDDFDDDFDGDGEEFGQEGEPGQPDQFQPRADDQRPRQEVRRDERPRQDDRPRQEGRRDERPRYNEARQGDGRQEQRPEPRQSDMRSEPRQDEQGGGYPSDRPRRQNGEQGYQRRAGNGSGEVPERGQAVEGGDREASATVPLAPSITTPVADDARLTAPEPATQEASTVRAADMDAPAPRRRGRPPRPRPEETAQADTAPVEGFDADRLPPSLSVAASAEPDAGEPAEKPRRRRRVVAPVEAGPAS